MSDDDEIKERFDDHEDRISELEKIYENRDLEKEVRIRLSELSYEYGLKQFVKETFFREWRKSNFMDIFGFGNKKAINYRRDLSLNVAKIRLENLEHNNGIATQASIIKSGKEFLDFSENASLLIKPILCYYGEMQIISGIIGCILNIELVPTGDLKDDEDNSDKNVECPREPKSRTLSHHGLRWSKGDGWNVTICPGFFEKIVLALDLSNESSKFINDYKKNLVFKINLRNYNNDIDHSQAHIEAFNFLVRYINIFYFNSKARYDPRGWNDFLKGKEQMYKTMLTTYQCVYSDLNWFMNAVRSLSDIKDNDIRLRQIDA